MAMEFIKKILKKKGVTEYRAARDLGWPHQLLAAWRGRGARQKGFRLDYLVALRRWSGLTWEDLGKMLDDEFG